MKNTLRDFEISRADFDSIFFWKVFWKQKNPLLLLLKVIIFGAAFVVIVLFIALIDDTAGVSPRFPKPPLPASNFYFVLEIRILRN